MKNAKLVAWGIVGSLILAVLATIFETSLTIETVDNLFGLAGFGFIVFGIWAVVLLFKNAE